MVGKQSGQSEVESPRCLPGAGELPKSGISHQQSRHEVGPSPRSFRPPEATEVPEGMNRALATVDLFAGAGGLSLGFHDAGFRILLGSDFDRDAARTFRRTFPDTPFAEVPIEQLRSNDILAATGCSRGELDVLLGGPPCQAFSVYNHQRGFHDQRSGLFREYLRIVEGVMPRVVIIENVVGMKSLGSGRAIEEIYGELGRLGFEVAHRVLEAEKYGVPQERRRIFFIASRLDGPIVWPRPTHGGRDDLFAQSLRSFVTVREAIADLPPLGIADGTDRAAPYTSPPTSDYQHLMRQGCEAVYNHRSPALHPINRRRMTHIPQGGSWRDIPFDLLPAGMKRAKRSDHTKRYGRLHPDGLASTILTKCDLHWGAYIHPDQDRTLTVREAARLQSFPDRIVFSGSRVEQYRQVGNAVPPLLAQAVATALRQVLTFAETPSMEALACVS